MEAFGRVASGEIDPFLLRHVCASSARSMLSVREYHPLFFTRWVLRQSAHLVEQFFVSEFVTLYKGYPFGHQNWIHDPDFVLALQLCSSN